MDNLVLYMISADMEQAHLWWVLLATVSLLLIVRKGKHAYKVSYPRRRRRLKDVFRIQ